MFKSNSSSDSAPIVLLHIPRTGGTTLQDLLKRQYPRDEILRVHDSRGLERLRDSSPTEKKRLRFVSGHVGFDFDTVLQDPFSYITFLRDPVARVTSAYQYICTNPQRTHHQIVTARNLSLAGFIRERISAINIDNGMTRLLLGEPNETHDVEFGQCSREMLKAAKRNLAGRITVVGLTEQFDASLVLLRRRFAWKSPLYTTKNSTKGSGAEPDSDTIELIQEHNMLDRELYEYGKKLFRRQILMALPSILYQVRYFQYKNQVHRQDPPAFERLRQFEYKRIARLAGPEIGRISV